jgi:LacI family transcriptional regulator
MLKSPLATLSLFLCCAAHAVQPHPRLLVTEADWENLPARMEADAAVREVIRATIRRADSALNAPPLTRTLTGRRLLSVSRDALQRTLDAAGYVLLLASHDFDADVEARVTRTLIERGVDGLVLLGTTHHPDIYRMIEAHGVPYVLTWAFDESGNHPCVGFDNRAAAVRITNYLLDLGHRRFAMVSGITTHNERAQERLAGVREALAARDIVLSDAQVVEKPYTHTGGRNGLREVMAAREKPTAVICGNDVLAIGAIAECHVQGLAVPGDVSVTGFDDMEIAAMMRPSLTTVRFPTAELGAYAANHLLLRLEGKAVDLRCKLPTELVVRESAAVPRAG